MILMPVSQTDFDPSEASIAWKILTDMGFKFQFATPTGTPGEADVRMLTGDGLGQLKHILMARKDAIDAYNEMIATEAYRKPLKYSDVRASDYEALILPGGHAPGMRVYLESKDLMKVIAEFMKSNKPLGAICHGVLLAARSQDSSGKSVLHGKKVTCLLKSQEMAAYNLTRLWLGTYYRTYPETTTQEEVVSFLASPDDFQLGPKPLFRDSETKMGRGFTVTDGKLITARWPGDAYNFGHGIAKLLAN